MMEDDDASLLSMKQELNAPLLDSDSSQGDVASRQSRPLIRVRGLRVVIDEERFVDVALLENADALAMHAAVTAALKDALLEGDSWWLVDGSSFQGGGEMIVPLCAALPDGCQLQLRTSSGKVKAPRGGARTRGREIRALGGSSFPGLPLGGGGPPSLVVPPVAGLQSSVRRSQESLLFPPPPPLPYTDNNDDDDAQKEPSFEERGEQPGGGGTFDQQGGRSFSMPRAPPRRGGGGALFLNENASSVHGGLAPKKENEDLKAPPATAAAPDYDAVGTGGGAFRSSFFHLSNALSAKARRDEKNFASTMVDFERMSKLTTDLANERTLLAWCRTALAIERTVFAFLGYKDSKGPNFFKHIYFVATALLATYAVFVGVIGVERFYKIKNAIYKKEPPAYYFRFSVQPSIVILGVILAVVCVSIYGHFIARV